MAFIIADRVKETTTTTGTGALTLAGTLTGFTTFAARCAVGDTLYYAIQAVDGTGAATGEWECGLGTYSAASTLTRTTVTSSSNSDAAVSFAAGTKQVFITMPAVQARWARERLTADRTYYVRTDGSDINTGLVDSSGGAFLTLQKAADVIKNTLDLSGFTVTVQVADGTYTAGVTLPEYAGSGLVAYLGNTTTPGNVIVSTTGASCFYATAAKKYTVSGFKVQTATSGSGLEAITNSVLDFSFMNFGVCAGSHIRSASGALITAVSNYAVTGGALFHAEFVEGGFIGISGRTLTITGTPAFAAGFCYGRNVSGLVINACTFSGSATGPRYNLNNLSSCYVGGASTSYLPGDSAGSIAGSAVYA